MAWHELTDLERAGQRGIRAKAAVDGRSDWFSGHFPGSPVLPGIAQLAMVFEAIEHASDVPVRVAGVTRVRFRQIIRPDDSLEVCITPAGEGSGRFGFRVMVRGEDACTGTMVVEPTADR